MKISPFTVKLEEFLRSSTLVKGGFMGTDTRNLLEIIEADAAQLAHLGSDQHEIARRMQHVTDTAEPQLGLWVKINDCIEAKVDEYLGATVCPWPHPAQCQKRITTIRRFSDDRHLRYSDLNTHLIDKHGFFQGKGSEFRQEPRELHEILSCLSPL